MLVVQIIRTFDCFVARKPVTVVDLLYNQTQNQFLIFSMGAIHSTKISGNFGPKPLFPVGPVGILVEWIAPNGK